MVDVKIHSFVCCSRKPATRRSVDAGRQDAQAVRRVGRDECESGASLDVVLMP